MGKIHKALEKSKKEQQSKKNAFQSLKEQRKVRLQSKNVINKRKKDIETDVAEQSDLSTIHTLLNDSSGIETSRSNQVSYREKLKPSGKLESFAQESKINQNINSEQEREISTVNKDRKLDAPLSKRIKDVDTRPSNEVIAEAALQDTQDNLKQKIVPLSSSQKSESDIQYIKDKDYEGEQETFATTSRQENYNEPIRLHYSLVTLGKPKSFEAEQFKILRANLLFPKKGKPPRTILLTSAVPGEGKTFTAMNLAVSLAQNINSHVLLVDADIRKPEVHKRFGLGDNIYGLSDFLTQNVPIPSLLVKTPLSNLTILPGGQATINPSELISSDKMKKLLDELSTRYSDRFVIIDAPPPKLASETYALARYVEHIIPVIRAGRSNRDLVDEMMNLLGKDKIQGVVLNCYDIRDTKRFGYYKYGEYYSK